MQKGISAFRQRQWDVAERLFASRPADPAAQKWLGMTYAAQEKFAQAHSPFETACRMTPRDPDACYYLGRTLYSLSRFELALAAYGKAAATGARNGRTLLGMALAYEALERDAEAERAYRDAIAAGEQQASVDFERFQRKRPRTVSPSPEIRFETRDLPFTVRNGATGKKHLPETMIAGVAVLDYDNDGWPDLFLVNGAPLPNALLRNNHDGTFTDHAADAGVAGNGAMGAASADFDNAGLPDLFIAALGGTRLYRNRGNGKFEDVTAKAGVGGDGSWSVAAAWLDFDNDGLLDLFVSRYVRYDAAKEPYCGTKDVRQYCHPREFAPLANLLYKNRGNGRFEDVSASSGISAHAGKGMGVAVGDYDLDGRLDIFVANDTMPNFLFHNLGNGKFEEVAAAAGIAFNENGAAISSMGAEFGDYDNDGREDLWITALSNEMFPLFRNKGGMFEDVTLSSGLGKASLPWSGWSNVMADFNNDGWKDLFSANGHVMDNAELTSGRASRQPNLLLTNGRTGFSGRTLAGETMHRGLAAADFDRDGRIDLVVTRLNQPAQILWNRTPQAGRWIALRLLGSTSNRDAIGAWVEIETPSGAKQWRRVPSSAGYGASPERVLHFGLARESEVTRIEIRWPSGKKQQAGPLSAGQLTTISEP
ncbi:MAG: CRTAC1 family protein [Bryobacteraceae bacterium]